MMLFIDTWGWINSFNRRERRHEEVARYYQNARGSRTTILTTDYILDEVYTLLFKRIPVNSAFSAIEIISDAVDMGYIHLIWITPERFKEAQNLRLRFRDKPDISFTDLTSMVVMQEFGISDILTGDVHFTYVGMGFILKP